MMAGAGIVIHIVDLLERFNTLGRFSIKELNIFQSLFEAIKQRCTWLIGKESIISFCHTRTFLIDGLQLIISFIGLFYTQSLFQNLQDFTGMINAVALIARHLSHNAKLFQLFDVSLDHIEAANVQAFLRLRN